MAFFSVVFSILFIVFAGYGFISTCKSIKTAIKGGFKRVNGNTGSCATSNDNANSSGPHPDSNK